MVSMVMLLCTFSIILRSYYSRRHIHNHNHGRIIRNTPILFDVNGDSPVSDGDDDDDDGVGRVIDHPIWFIRTVGLQQSVIDSITVFKYRKNEGLIDGTECSVCLGEFQQEESLRLLPKCSHAFHIPCIDTWLRSHTNCPLCRAPVVVSDGGSSSSTEVRVTDETQNQEAQIIIENFDGDGGGGDDDDDGMSSSSEIHHKILHNLLSQEVEEEIVQPVRRSVSMDSSSAASVMFCAASVVESSLSSETHFGDKINSSSCSKDIIGKHNGSGSSSKLASSIGRVLQKRPISTRRSFSHSRKFLFSSRHCRSQSSTLPL